MGAKTILPAGLAAAMAAAMAAAPAPALAAPSKPSPIGQAAWFGADDYPAPALVAGEQGDVSFRLDVDPAGAIAGCTVTRSSGSALLDRTTCDLLRARARFEPARNRRGRAIASTWSSHIRWRMPDDQPLARAGLEVTTIEVQSDGKVISCTTVVDGEAGGNPARCAALRSADRPGWVADYARAFRILRLQEGWGEGDWRPGRPDPAWGELIAERTSELSVSAEGAPIECRVLSEHGPAAVRLDACAANAGTVRQNSGKGVAPRAKVVDSWALYGEPRRRRP
jgi:periplasmic protein TonB